MPIYLHTSIEFRSFVRLAEHDTRIETDTKHEDIKITRSEPHKDYDGLTYDILMVYLEKDVTFRGESTKTIRLNLNSNDNFVSFLSL